ncbi:MAG: septal ring lytic transglycosylase RlpA family protein [Gammaproteobacteria bacterium]|nr:septal ring lytic transglycosylase RlpA family protein [Gammaproteobacteria bacterium]
MMSTGEILVIRRFDGRRRFVGRLALLLVLLGATGCFRVNTPRAARAALPPDARPRQEYKSCLGNPAFYDELGVRYRVLETSRDYVQRGIASWYGDPFHGRTTSAGETYDMYAMTAAHNTLPLPTYVRVTDLDTGNRVVVRVNDRGPFVEGRVIDLSYSAAVRLGIAERGTARVEVRALDPPAMDPPRGRCGAMRL